MKIKTSVQKILLLSGIVFAMAGCSIKYLDGPSVRAKQAPPSTKLSYPSFPKVANKKTTDGKVKKIYSNLVEYTDLKPLESNQQRNWVCRQNLDVSLLKNRFDQLTEIAKITVALASKEYYENIRVLKSRRPEFKDLVKRINKQKGLSSNPAEENVETGMLWLLTDAIATNICATATEDSLQKLAVSLVHTMSSKEALYQLYFTSFMQKLKNKSFDQFWVIQQQAKISVGELIGKLMEIKNYESSFRKASNISLVSSNEGMPISCSSEVKISKQNSPNLILSGSHVANDSQFYLQVECKNTSKDKMLMSESILQSGRPNSCLSDASKEKVLVELEPGDSGSVVLGPYLVTEECQGKISHSYVIRSSNFSSRYNMTLNMDVRETKLEMNKPKIDQDLPGFSRKDSDGIIGSNEYFEVLLEGKLSNDYKLNLMNLKTLPEDEPTTTMSFDNKGLPFKSNGSTQILRNDIDIQTLGKEQWNSVVNQRNSSNSSSIYISDKDKMWFQAKYIYVSSCELASDFLPDPLNILYKQVCNDFQYEAFAKWLEGLYRAGCTASNIEERMNKAKSLTNVMDKALGKESKKDENLILSKDIFINPSYAQTAKAIDRLLFFDVISEQDLDVALQYLDTLHFQKVPANTSRELGRQLLLAAYIAQETAKELGPDDLKELNVYRNGSAKSIKELEQAILDLKIVQSIAKEARLKNSGNTMNSRLQQVIQKMINTGKCAPDSSPIPPSPPIEVRSATRYFSLPISTDSSKDNKDK